MQKLKWVIAVIILTCSFVYKSVRHRKHKGWHPEFDGQRIKRRRLSAGGAFP